MTVNELLKAAWDYEWVCVEDDDYNVFVEDEAQFVRKSKEIRGLKVVCFQSGIRSNRQGMVIIAERKKSVPSNSY